VNYYHNMMFLYYSFTSRICRSTARGLCSTCQCPERVQISGSQCSQACEVSLFIHLSYSICWNFRLFQDISFLSSTVQLV